MTNQRQSSAVSVVVTCFNLERYIGEAIGSVLAQVDSGAVEIIVVDDCSIDDSARVISGFAGVRLVQTERNSGVMLAMLAGVEAAANDRICFLDGDDLWEPGKLAAVQRCFDEGCAVGLVTHDLTFIDGEGLPIERRSLPAARIGAAKPSDRADLVRRGILELDDYVWLGSALCIRRSLAEWDEFAAWARALPDPRNTYQDWPLAFWVAARPGVLLDYVPSPLFRYRLHGANHSGDARTPEKAIRNFRRALNTVLAMADVATRQALPSAIRDTLASRIRFAEYLVAIHEGKRGTAAFGFVKSMRYLWQRKLLGKEAARFMALQLLGPRRFADLVAWRIPSAIRQHTETDTKTVR